MKFRLVPLIIVCVLIVQSCILIVFMISNYILDKNELNKQADQHLMIVEDRFEKSLPELLWNYNEEAVNSNLLSELNEEYITGIIIENEGEVEYQVFKEIVTQNEIDQHLTNITTLNSKELFYDSFDGLVKIADLYLISDRSSLDEKLKKSLFVQLFQLLILDIVLMVSIWISIYFLVKKPVDTIKDGLQSIVKSGDILTKTLPKHYIYEINELSGNYNLLNKYISEMFEDIQLQSDNIEAIFDNTNNAMLLIDGMGEVQSANNAVKKIFKTNIDDAISIITSKVFGFPKIRFFMDPVNRLGKKSISLEIDLSDDNKKFYISVTLSKIKLGVEKAFILVIQDVTENNILYQEIEVALEKEQENTKLKSEFLASMSHEIRTPMNGVIGMLDLLAKTNLTDQQEHYNKIAKSSAGSLLVIINDILDFSKIEAGKLEVESVEFDLLQIITEVSQTLSVSAHEKGLNIWLDTSAFLGKLVVGDSIRLRQILTNLISNAIKFTKQGDILIKLFPQKIKDDQIVFSCSVTDSGIGIPKDKIDKLFESFSQVDTSTTRQYGGTGLGLSIVKQLCLLMDGDVEVKSEFGKGSEFKFTVVFDKPEYIKERSISNTALKDKKIVLVNSNHMTKELLVNQLELISNNIEVVGKINDELSLTADFVIIDYSDISQDLNQFIDQIKVKDSNTQIILINHINHMLEAKKINELNGVTQLSKPFAFEDLVTCFDEEKKPKQIEVKTQKEEVESESEKPRVLLVEDNFVNQEIALALLEGFNLEIDVANNGLEAIDLLKKQSNQLKYKLVFMDCQMPKMDGYEATEAIRKGEADIEIDGINNKVIPIIAMTANAMKGDREKCIGVGMDDYLSKPIDEETLESKIKKWMK